MYGTLSCAEQGSRQAYNLYGYRRLRSFCTRHVRIQRLKTDHQFRSQFRPRRRNDWFRKSIIGQSDDCGHPWVVLDEKSLSSAAIGTCRRRVDTLHPETQRRVRQLLQRTIQAEWRAFSGQDEKDSNPFGCAFFAHPSLHPSQSPRLCERGKKLAVWSRAKSPPRPRATGEISLEQLSGLLRQKEFPVGSQD